MWIIWAAKRAETNYIGWSCTVIKKKKERKKDEGGDESPVLKMILNPADRDASALLSLAASQNGPFLYIQTSWSLISCNWFHSLCCLSSVQTEPGRIIPPSVFFFCFFLLSLRAHGWVRVGAISLLVAPDFFSSSSSSLRRLSSKNQIYLASVM